ncbi:MAG: DNA-binding response regulator [Opitutus sp.]|nr:DNA-binding response regulator [Opitutus sp.]
MQPPAGRNAWSQAVKETLTGFQILVVEDEPLLRRRIAATLSAQGAEVKVAGNLGDAEALARSESFDLALLDVHLPDGRGTDLLSGSLSSGPLVIVMTAEGGVEGAVAAMRLGAADYLVKPFDLDELPVRIQRARRSQLRARAEESRSDGPARSDAGADLFFGPGLRAVQQQLDRILEADRQRRAALPPVLIEGETGTGKTTLARWLHRQGPRAKGPLIELNCSAVPEALAESELFGHERGAFTDASSTRIGLMEAAEGGTLFLDEVPSLALPTQAKLLSAIEDRAIRRVGANRPRPVDVRIIAASNADLRERVEQGRFRSDLLQRLDLFRVRLPPLRERGDDIVPLCERLAARIAAQYGRKAPSLPPEGRQRLRAYHWPGNVRELAHEIERALVFDPDDGLTFRSLTRTGAAAQRPQDWLSGDFRLPAQGFSLEAAIDGLIQRALQQSDGNVSAAARLLGVPRDYLRYRLKDRAEDGK